MPRLDPIITTRLRWLVWKLRLKGWLLKRYWPHTYLAVNEPIWMEGRYEVFHDWGGGFLVMNDSSSMHIETFNEVVDCIRGR